MGFKLQEAYVEIDGRFEKLKEKLEKVRGLVASRMRKLAVIAATAFAAGAAGIGAAVVGSLPLIKLGADAEEMRSKFDAVFKGEAGAARKWAEAFADGVGRSQIELEGMLANTQALIAPMGFARNEARNLSQNIVNLAVDLASFNNLADDEALAKLKSGIMGEAEPLKSLGIVINEVALNQQLMRMGYAKNTQEASEQAKMLARLQIIMNSTKDAHGDAAKTADSLSNQWKRLKGALVDLGTEMGTMLIPAAKAVVTVLNKLVEWVRGNQGSMGSIWDWFSQRAAAAYDFVRPVVEGVVSAIYSLIEIGMAIGPALGNAFLFVGEQWLGFQGTVYSGIGSLIGWIQQLVLSVVEFGFRAGDTFAWVATVTDTLAKAWGTLKEWASDAFKFIWEGIKDIGFALLNWDLTVEALGLTFAQTFDNIVGHVTTFGENAVSIFNWAFDNLRDIGFTALDYLLTVFINLGQNIRNIWQGVLNYIKGQGFEVDFTPLTEGFRSTLKSMPELKEFVNTDAYADAFAKLDKQWEERSAEWGEVMKKNAPFAGDELMQNWGSKFEDMKAKFEEFMGGGGKGKTPGLDFNAKNFNIKGKAEGKGQPKAEFKSLDSVWKDLQAGIFKKQDNIPKQQLNLQQQQLNVDKQILTAVQKPKQATMS